MTSMPIQIALVVPDLAVGGGVSQVAAFLYDALANDPHFSPRLLSMATSRADPASTAVLRPRSWIKDPQAQHRTWHGRPYVHVGCRFSEIELQRYRPNPVLLRCLAGVDLVQVVAGAPAWALPVAGFRGPICLQVATLVAAERQSLLRTAWTPGRSWRRLMTTLTTRFERRAMALCERVFVENQWMERHAIGLLGRERVVWAPPGIDTTAFTPGEYNPNGPILCVGRLTDPRKNIRLLLHAYKLLCERLPAAPPLLLAGKQGPTTEDMQLSRELGIDTRIEVREDLSLTELIDIYRRASLFVLSSDEEGLGLVLLEAMACGVPVVSTRCGGPEGIIKPGETGLLCDPGAPDQLAAEMHRALVDPTLRMALRTAALVEVRERFSHESCAGIFLNTYHELIGR